MTRAGPGGGFTLWWGDFVDVLYSAFVHLMSITSDLFYYFSTPLQTLIDDQASQGPDLTNWLLSVLSDILDLFGLDIMHYTPFQLMLGPLIPVLLFVAIYHFFKR